MFIEVEVEAGDNCDFSFTRIYSSIEDPQVVAQVAAPGPRGEIGRFDVTGWSTQGPTKTDSCHSAANLTTRYTLAEQDAGFQRSTAP